MSYERAGQICHKKNGNAVAHKKNGGVAIIYKKTGNGLGAATFTISWGSGDKDLDLCAYWYGNEDGAVGWNHSSQSASPYEASWGGDNTSEGGSETITAKMTPWKFSGARRFYIKCNFYGESEGAGTCNVTVTSGSGKTKTVNGVSCSKNRGTRATTGDPGVVATFDDLGEIVSLTTA